MADYTLAQAYVQILPTTKGIKNNLESELSEEGEKAGKSAGKSTGSYFAKAFAGAVTAAGSTIAAFATKLIKDVVSYYGEYEQLAGGIEKLYEGLNPEQVLANADKAFQTAQISANDYLQTVTSFSASLISSLGDDSAAAAKYADMAIIDMADNANTFGTSMENIQNAYQGFAKGQFTMLDNLKLGYGGTKTEMERLIADANKVKVANGEMADLSIDSFSDMVEAIHIIQTEMNISGLTAEEAAEMVASGAMTEEEAFKAMGTSAKEGTKTIQGSLNTLKAAWRNLITGLGDADADVSKLATNVITSFQNVVKNIEPIIKQIAAALPQAISVFVDAIPTFVNDLLPPLVEGFIALFEGLIEALPQIFPVLLEGAMQIILMLIDHIDEIVVMLIDMIIAILIAIAENIDTIIPALVEGIVNAILALVKHIPEFLVAIFQLLLGIFEGLFELLVSLGENLYEKILKPIGEWLAGIWKAVWDWLVGVAEGIIQWFVDAWHNIEEWFNNLIDSIVEWITKIWDDVTTWLSDTWNSIVDWFAGLIKGVVDWFAGIWQSISDWFSGLFSDLGNWLSTTFKQIADWFGALPGKVWGWMKNVGATIGNWFAEKWEEFKGWGRRLIEGLWNGIKDAAEWVKNKIKGWVDDVLGFFKNILGIHSPSTLFAQEIGKYIPMGVGVGIEENTDYATDAIEVMGNEISDSMSSVLSDIDNEILGTSLPESISMNQDINDAISGRALLDSSISISESAEERLNRIIDLLEMFFPLSLEKEITLDGDSVVGALAPKMNLEFNKLSVMEARGV